MTAVTCVCSEVELALDGPPILTAECHCTSCREAAKRLRADVTAPNGGTPFVLWRKDCARMTRGAGHLASFRLSPEATTERVVASCCGAPIWLEIKGGHWLSLYSARWTEGAAPAPEMRTMVRDAPGSLPDDLPNAPTQSAAFMARLFWAWVRMGFRNPQVADVRRTHDA